MESVENSTLMDTATPSSTLATPQLNINSQSFNFDPLKFSPIIITTHDGERNDIPTFNLNEDQSKDPIKFIESVKDQGQKYGAIKIILSPNQQTILEHNLNITQDFKFKSSSILFSSQDELLTRLQFFTQLLDCYTASKQLEAPISDTNGANLGQVVEHGDPSTSFAAPDSSSASGTRPSGTTSSEFPVENVQVSAANSEPLPASLPQAPHLQSNTQSDKQEAPVFENQIGEKLLQENKIDEKLPQESQTVEKLPPNEGIAPKVEDNVTESISHQGSEFVSIADTAEAPKTEQISSESEKPAETGLDELGHNTQYEKIVQNPQNVQNTQTEQETPQNVQKTVNENETLQNEQKSLPDEANAEKNLPNEPQNAQQSNGTVHIEIDQVKIEEPVSNDIRIKEEIKKVTETPTNYFQDIPVINRKPIDLYRLFKAVQISNGFLEVSERNLWPKICGELSFDTNHAESIMVAYEKIIYPFENMLQVDKIELNGTSQLAEDSTFINENGKRNLDENSSTVKGDSKRLRPDGDHPLVLGSAKQISRSLKSKVSKGFPIYAPNNIDFNKSQLVSPRNQLNHCLKAILDNHEVLQDDFYNSNLQSSVYKLSDFMNKELQFQKFIVNQFKNEFTESDSRHFIKHSQMEELFWKLANCNKNTDIEVKFGKDIPSRFNSFGFVKEGDGSMKGSNEDHFSETVFPWNLHNLPILPNSLLGTLAENDMTNPELASPKLNVSGTFSVTNWSCQDQFTQLAVYHHLGSNKVWGFIPESEFSKFESLVQEVNNLGSDRVHLNNSELNANLYVPLVENQNADVLANALQGTTNPTPHNRFQHVNKEFLKELAPASTKLNQEFLITPKLLQEKGITYYETVQKPGEFIIQYPKTYSASKSFGFNITEEVNFATNCWLDYAVEGENWLSNQGILPNFLTFKMLINLIQVFESGKSIGYDSDTYKKVQVLYEELFSKELELRQEVRKFKIKETVVDEKFINYADAITDSSLKFGFPSKVVISDKKEKTKFSMCLQEFIVHKDKWINSKDYTLELQLFYSDEKLKYFAKLISSYSIDYGKWVEEYEAAMKENEQLSLKVHKSLLSDGEKIASAVETIADKDDEKLKKFKGYIQSLKVFIDSSNRFIEECQNLLAIKYQQRIRNNTEFQRASLLDLVKLIEKIPSLNFSSTETDQVLELQQEIENFDRASRTLISKKNRTFQEFNDLINLGESFGIDIPSLRFITRIRDRIKWIKVFNLIDKGADPYSDKKEVFSLKDLVDFYEEGEKILAEEDFEMFEKIQVVVNDSIKFNNEVSQFVKYDFVDNLNLAELEKMADTFRLEKIFLSSENYNELSKLHINSHLIRQLQDLIVSEKTFPYSEIKQLQNLLRETDLKFNPDIFVKELYPAEVWVFKMWEAIRNVQVITTMDKGVDLDHLNLRVSLNLGLIEKLYQLYYKSEYNFSEEDTFEKSSAYLTRYQQDEKSDDTKYSPIYCICREYEFGVMIECDHCNEWYHIACVNKDQKGAEEDNYVCPVCKLVESNDTMNDFLKNQVVLNQLIEFKQEGDLLRTYPGNERKVLDELCDQYSKFNIKIKQDIEEIENSQQPLKLKIDLLKFYLRKLYGCGIIMHDELTKAILLIRQYEYELNPPPVAVETNEAIDAETNSTQQIAQLDPTLVQESEPYANDRSAIENLLAAASMQVLVPKTVQPGELTGKEVSNEPKVIEADTVPSNDKHTDGVITSDEVASSVVVPIKDKDAVHSDNKNSLQTYVASKKPSPQNSMVTNTFINETKESFANHEHASSSIKRRQSPEIVTHMEVAPLVSFVNHIETSESLKGDSEKPASDSVKDVQTLQIDTTNTKESNQLG